MKLKIAPHSIAERVPITPMDKLMVVPGHDGSLRCYVEYESLDAKRAYCGILCVSDRSELPQGTFNAIALTAGNGFEVPVKLALG